MEKKKLSSPNDNLTFAVVRMSNSTSVFVFNAFSTARPRFVGIVLKDMLFKSTFGVSDKLSTSESVVRIHRQ